MSGNRQKLPKVAVFENGEIRDVSFGETGRDVVLALPLSRLILRVVRVPAGEDPVEFATPVLAALSPFPDEPLTVSCETVRETERGSVVIAAALPESATDDIASALDARKFNVTRVDSLEIGQLRAAWSRFSAADGCRRLIKIKSQDSVALIVLDGDQPLSIRSVSDESELKREETLSLLQAEDFGGARELADTIEIEMTDEALAGVAERSVEPDSLNALPESWATVLAETRFKAKLTARITVAVVLWLLAMGVLLGVPIAYGYMTDHQKDLSRAHAGRYREVKEMRAKVELVRKYSDHSRGALEVMKAVSDRLPEGITLTSWAFKHDEGVRVSGEAETAGDVYEFKNVMSELAAEDGNGEEVSVFPVVELKGPSATSKNKQRFDLDLSYRTGEEE